MRRSSKEIYAASFCYDEHGVACWPAMAVNYTSKTQFLFRVNKGVLDVTEHRALNEFMPEEKRRVPFSNMIYIGDGLTDVPSMKLTKLNGGHSIAVWQENEWVSNEMLLEGRVDFVVKADYSQGSEMEKTVSPSSTRLPPARKPRRCMWTHAITPSEHGRKHEEQKAACARYRRHADQHAEGYHAQNAGSDFEHRADGARRRARIGPPTGGMRRYVDELELAKYGNYAISYNGACVTNMQTNEMVYKNALPDYVAPWMLDYAREHGLGMCIYDGNTVVCGTDVDRYIERETVLNGFNRVSVENFDAYRGMDMFKALLTAPPFARRSTKRLARRFISRLSIYRSEPYFIEVMPRGWTKGAAIAGLIERLGMERGDVIACGDGLNDLAMIRYAGLGVAMGNAQSEIKAAADVVTGTNDEDGIVSVIEQYILNA